MKKLTGPQETLLEKINLYKYIKNVKSAADGCVTDE